MNIAFIITSYWSFGELMIAIMFAKSINKFGYNPYFFAPENQADILKQEGFPFTVIIKGMGNINKMLFKDYASIYKPKLVILSDFLNYNFCEAHYGLTYTDLEAFNCKFGTFDNFDWTFSKRKMDTYGFTASKVLNVDIEKYGFRLIPCPIAYPHRPVSNSHYYSLTTKLLDGNVNNKVKLRNELGLTSSHKIILMTTAMWQETYKSYPFVTDFVDRVYSIYEQILEALSDHCTIICVGKKRFSERISNVNYIDRLQPEMFDKYAACADLYISQNITSTSLARISLSGIPTLVLMSSIVNMSHNNYCYPYWMFPVGWYDFLNPILENNPYLSIVNIAEIFNIDDTINTIINILYQKENDINSSVKLNNYISCLKSLKRPNEIIDDLLAK